MAAGGRRAPAWDPVVTVGLLVFGLINVTQTVAQARQLDVVLDQFFQQQGIGRYTDAAAAQAAGGILIAADVLCLVLAIGFAVPRMRAHRLAFWVPVVCALVAVVATTGLIAGAAFADPAFGAYLQSHA